MAKDPAGRTPAPRKTTHKKPATPAKKVAGKAVPAAIYALSDPDMSTKKQAVKPVKKVPKPRAPNAADLKRHICEQISDGVPLQQICREPGMPAWRTVYGWMEADEKFAADFARARELGADAIAEDSMRIVDELPERGPDGKIDPGSVAHAKLRAEHRLKLLAKWSPKKYGDKVQTELSGPGGGAIAVQSTVTFVHSPRREEDD